MTNTKKRILFCTESAHIKSGYGNYTRSILTRLYSTNKYEIAELSCYRTVSQEKEYPWKIYPNAVDKTDSRFQHYNANLNNQFGQWRFDLVVADFKPDIVIDFRDVFMTVFERTSVFRNKFHWVLAPTIDSFPVKHEWLDLLKNCDTLLTHTEWAKNEIEKQYGIKVAGVVRDSIDYEIFRPKNKIACRTALGLDINSFIIGSVMRNQKRKLIPDLFKVINVLNNQLKENVYLYLHSSYPELMGWDIPDLLLEHNIQNSVLFTYVCKGCKHWIPMQWKGPQYICPKCNQLKMTLASVSNGLDDKDLCQLYNTLDLYIQYAVCEGFGIPPLEAASCGIPFLTVDHGAMAEIADDLGGYKVPLSTLFRDSDHNADRAYPNNDMCVSLIQKYKSMPETERLKISEKYLQLIKHKHSWDLTAKTFEQILDSITVDSDTRWQPISQEYFTNLNKSSVQTTNNREFIYSVVDKILESPQLKSSFFIEQVIMALDNGYIISDKNLVPYTQQDALKTLEMWFNNKTMLNKFLEDKSVIAQNDFLNY